MFHWSMELFPSKVYIPLKQCQVYKIHTKLHKLQFWQIVDFLINFTKVNPHISKPIHLPYINLDINHSISIQTNIMLHSTITLSISCTNKPIIFHMNQIITMFIKHFLFYQSITTKTSFIQNLDTFQIQSKFHSSFNLHHIIKIMFNHLIAIPIDHYIHYIQFQTILQIPILYITFTFQNYNLQHGSMATLNLTLQCIPWI